MKGLKTGGRKAGTPNKRTEELRQLAKESGVNPFLFLLMVVKNDLIGLGLKKPRSVDEDEEEFVLPIPLALRIDAAKELLPYLFPRLKPQEDGEESDSDGKIRFVSRDEFNKAKE